MSLIQVNNVLDWMFQGSDYTLRVQIKQDHSGVPYNLSNTQAYMILSDTEFSDDTVLEKEGTVTDPELGLITFELTVNDTQEILPKSYVLMVFIKTDSNKFIPVLQGILGVIAAQPMEGSGS